MAKNLFLFNPASPFFSLETRLNRRSSDAYLEDSLFTPSPRAYRLGTLLGGPERLVSFSGAYPLETFLFISDITSLVLHSVSSYDHGQDHPSRDLRTKDL